MEAKREPGMIHVKAMAIIKHNNSVLATKGFDKTTNTRFFRLIGGGVHYCENAVDALKREVKEELGSDIDNIEFLSVVENVFTHQGEPGHEVIFLYKADLVDTGILEQAEIPIIDSPSRIAVWVPVTDILSGNAVLYPATDYKVYLQ